MESEQLAMDIKRVFEELECETSSISTRFGTVAELTVHVEGDLFSVTVRKFSPPPLDGESMALVDQLPEGMFRTKMTAMLTKGTEREKVFAKETVKQYYATPEDERGAVLQLWDMPSTDVFKMLEEKGATMLSCACGYMGMLVANSCKLRADGAIVATCPTCKTAIPVKV